MPDTNFDVTAGIRDTLLVPLRMDSGEIAVEFMGRRFESKEWLPQGCCGILFVFKDVTSMRAMYGEDVPFTALRTQE